MNYEVKFIAPGPIFRNTFRICITIGFIVALLSFFLMPNPRFQLMTLWQKIAATLLFTGVYGLVIGFIALFIALMYNAWVQPFGVRSFFFRVLSPSLIAGAFSGVAFGFERPGDAGFMMRLLTAIVASLVLAPLLALIITLVTFAWTAVLGPFSGATFHLEQKE